MTEHPMSVAELVLMHTMVHQAAAAAIQMVTSLLELLQGAWYLCRLTYIHDGRFNGAVLALCRTREEQSCVLA